MSQSYIQVAPDGGGKKLQTWRNTIGTDDVDCEAVVLVDQFGVPITQPVSVASLPLPNGASTEATLALIKAKTDNLDVAISTRTKPADQQHVIVDSSGLPTGAAQDSTLTGGTQKTKIVDTGGTNVASVSAAGAVKVDGSAATQPVSLATNTPDVTDRAARLLGHVTVDSAPTTAVTGPLTDAQLRASAVPVDATPASPAANDYLPVRLTDGAMFNFNQPTYILYQMPRVTTAAATDFFDLFNASGSGKKVRLLGIYPVIQVTAASAVIPTWQFSLIRTSAVGTGGTAATVDGAASPTTGLINITRNDTTDAALPAQITCRALPTGGATASKFIFDIWLGTEETNAATYLTQMFNWLPVGDAIKELVLAEGEGIKIRQITATASTGTNFGWLIAFTLI